MLVVENYVGRGRNYFNTDQIKRLTVKRLND